MGGKDAKRRPKKKRRLVDEEQLVVGGVSVRVWRFDRKWFIGWDEGDDSKVYYRGKKTG